MWLAILGLFIFALGLIIFGVQLIKAVINILALMWYAFYDLMFVIPKHRKSEFFLEKTRKEVEAQYDREVAEENVRRTHVMGAMNFVTKMRVLYPLADENLFREAYENLPKESCYITPNEYEKMISESHKKNLVNQQDSKNTTTKIYTLADLDNRNPIETRTEYPITMSLYKINNDYVLLVDNVSVNEKSLFQSEDYSLMANYMMSVVELQQKLHESKISVVATQLEDIFNDKQQKFNFEIVKRNDLFR